MLLPEWAVWFDVVVAPGGESVRHRVLFGGRGGAKSWTIAHKIVERTRTSPIRVLCTREYQNSIRDSSKKLIEDSIVRMDVRDFFTVTETEIRGRNGSLISFVGLNGKSDAIKSLEGYDLAWVEEAATLSQASLEALIPTIRKQASEIWWSYNPRYQTDPVDRLFRGGRPPPGAIVLEVQWRDNPWFPDELRRDMEYDRNRDPERHAHIWEGHYVMRSEAQVFHNWQVLSFESPDNAQFRFGADWGYAVDPTVLVRCFVGTLELDGAKAIAHADPKGTTLFVDFEAYEVSCPIEQTPALFAGSDTRQPPRWPNARLYPGIAGASRTKIIADSARPETIAHMKARGFDIEAAIKGPGSVEDGIEFLKSYDVVVHPRCRHLVDELTHYSWKVDRQTGDILSQLADKDNHVIDALRYALEGARKARSSGFTWSSSGQLSIAEQLDGYLLPGAPYQSIERYPDIDMSRGWGVVCGRSRGILNNY